MNFIENTQHPISLTTNPRIDIFFGRRQNQTAEDMMLLMHQSLAKMEAAETILLINSLCVHDDLANSVDRIGKYHKAKALVYSASGAKLREKLDFLSALIVAQKVRMIIVNSWEFAACGSRQKHALAGWLREMRDGNKVTVVVYSSERECPKYGALSELSFTASSMDEVAEWRWHNKYQKDLFYENATEAAVHFADDVDAALEKAKIESKETTTAAMTIPRRQVAKLLNFVSAGDLLKAAAEKRSPSLKNNDLAPVSAHPGDVATRIEVFEPEEEYAMAA